MALFIVRHGETAGNATGIVQMPATPLNERGLLQAERIAERVAALGVSRVITSDYARAFMTAQKIAEYCALPLETSELLRERNFGDLRGRRHVDIGDLYAPDLAPPNGETWQQFHARVERAWSMMKNALAGTSGNLVVVTHGLVCYSLALSHLQLPQGTGAGFGIGNTALTVVENAPPWQVSLLNCTSHLQDIGFGAMDRQGA